MSAVLNDVCMPMSAGSHDEEGAISAHRVLGSWSSSTLMVLDAQRRRRLATLTNNLDLENCRVLPGRVLPGKATNAGIKQP
jgi:hypothetical protein